MVDPVKLFAANLHIDRKLGWYAHGLMNLWSGVDHEKRKRRSEALALLHRLRHG